MIRYSFHYKKFGMVGLFLFVEVHCNCVHCIEKEFWIGQGEGLKRGRGGGGIELTNF